MEIILYILAVIFALFVLAILGLIVAADIVRTKEYIKANRTNARVNGYTGVKTTSNYGLLQASSKYHEYDVSYMVNGMSYTGRHLSKEARIMPGQIIEIRYVVDDKGEVKIVNRNIKDRFFRMLICAAIAIPLCIVIILVKNS